MGFNSWQTPRTLPVHIAWRRLDFAPWSTLEHPIVKYREVDIKSLASDLQIDHVGLRVAGGWRGRSCVATEHPEESRAND